MSNPFKSPKVPKTPTVTPVVEDDLDMEPMTGVSQTVSAGFDLLPNVEKLRKALGLR